MGIFSKFRHNMIDKGGVASIGVLCTLLYLDGKLPSYAGPVAYGITTFGIYGVFARIAMHVERNEGEDILIEVNKLMQMLEEKYCEERNFGEVLYIFSATRELVKLCRSSSWILEEKIEQVKFLQSKLSIKILNRTVNNELSITSSTLLEKDKHFPGFKNFEKNLSPGLDENTVNRMVKEHAEIDDRLTSLQEKASKLFVAIGSIHGDNQNRLDHSLKADCKNEALIFDEDIKFFGKTDEKSDEGSKIKRRTDLKKTKYKVNDDENTEKDMNLKEYEDGTDGTYSTQSLQQDNQAEKNVQQQSGEQGRVLSVEGISSRCLTHQDDSLIIKGENETSDYREDIRKLSDVAGEKSEEKASETKKKVQHTPSKPKIRASEITDTNAEIESMENIKNDAPEKKDFDLEFLDDFDWDENLVKEAAQEFIDESGELIDEQIFSYIKELEKASTDYHANIDKLSDKAGEKSEENVRETKGKLLHTRSKHKVNVDENTEAKIEIQSQEKIQEETLDQKVAVQTQLPSLVRRNKKILLKRRMMEEMIRRNAVKK